MAIRKKTRRRIMIAVLVTGAVLMMGIMTRLQIIAARDPYISFGGNLLPINSLNGVVQSLINLLCVIILCISHKNGSLISLGLLGVQMFSAMRAVFTGHTLGPLPGVMNIGIVMIMILIIRRFLVVREKDATTDFLTGLYNRRGLLKFLGDKDSKQGYFFIYIDIDDFKYINDNLGHKCGDRVLKIISERLVEVAGKGAVCSRLSGDEFVMILPKLVDIDRSVKDVIAKIGEKINVLGENGMVDCYVTASVGVSAYPNDSTDPEELLKYADIAMYEAKKNGKNNYCVYDKSFENEIRRQAELEALIKESLENDYFYLVYQPQYVTESKTLRGFETLIRLKTPDGVFVSPGEFIPAAEKTDLILRIDEYVVKRAMREFSEVVKKSGNNFTVSINVSAKNICRYGFADMVKRAAEETDFPYECLEIEITEYCLAQALDIAIANISELKFLGVEIALDDFGTGYASLSYLSKLSIDLLKIDKSFIDEIDKTKKDNDFISAVIAIGHLHDCTVISEGVEHENQLKLLKDLGCDFIQGYIWGKPLPYDDAVALTESCVTA